MSKSLLVCPNPLSFLPKMVKRAIKFHSYLSTMENDAYARGKIWKPCLSTTEFQTRFESGTSCVTTTFERGEKTPTPKISALLRKRPVLLSGPISSLLRTENGLTTDIFVVKYTGRGLVVKRPGVLSKVQMTLVLGVGVFFFPFFHYLSWFRQLQRRRAGAVQKEPQRYDPRPRVSKRTVAKWTAFPVFEDYTYGFYPSPAYWPATE